LPLQLDLVHPVVQVRDLARNLDVSCAQILPIASALGLRVSCPSTVITLEQAAQIECAYLRANPAPLEKSSSQVSNP
jgi:hypothetical protein